MANAAPRSGRAGTAVPETAAVATGGFPMRSLLPGALVVASLAVGAWVYLDARARGKTEWAAFLAVAVGGLFLAGSLPGLVALAVADDAATQGFPTAIRVVPALVALAVYWYTRRKLTSDA